MAYIGNPPAERFTSFDYQDLTGGTGTSFTLTHPVGNAQEILVMVNNVVQEPGVAYTVSGTGLTMTGSIAAADDFYVVYRGKAIQTATHPSDRALTATDGTFSGDLTVDTNTLHVDATNNRVGVNTASPAVALEIDGTSGEMLRLSSTNINQASIVARASDDTNRWKIGTLASNPNLFIEASNASGDMIFRTGGENERMRILDGGGLTFNGDTAAANALDDYEEGTWTPQISATDGIGTLTYSAQVGHYTKIGNRVNFHMYVLINQKGTVAGSIRYTLPFSSASVTNLYTAVSFWVNGSVNGQVFDGDFHLQAYIAPGSSIVVPQSLDGDGGVTHLNAAHISNGMDVMIAGHYRV
nr:hypothetical protein [uncultured Mediterranean phage uvMED]